MERHAIRVGSAGWSVPREHAERFAPGGSHLARYATRFTAVEINSSFYHPHRPSTYARWAATTPDAFRFAVKVPRTVTHERRLIDVAEPLGHFFDEVEGLSAKLGPVLVQLPPSLAFDPPTAASFWRVLRERFRGDVVCEPRHPSWFAHEASRLLQAWDVARAIADPPPVPQADEPAGWPGLRYLRLHGSPRMYYDHYDDAYLEHLASRLVACAQQAPVWCIFDNTAAGAATTNASRLLEYLRAAHVQP